MHLSEKQKVFSQYTSIFSKLALNVEYFQTEMTSIAYVFPKLQTPEEVVR